MEARDMATRSARTSRSKSSTSRSSTRSSTGTTAKRTYPTKSGKRSATPPSRRWSAKVKTDSTKPAAGIFKKSAKEIAENLSKKSVSPKGPGQAMQMLSFYENRGGKNLSSERKHTLENAKDILREKEEKQSAKDSGKSSKRSSGSSRTKSRRTSGRVSSRSHTRRSSRKTS
jgi:tRNA(adenine34) deaminase